MRRSDGEPAGDGRLPADEPVDRLPRWAGGRLRALLAADLGRVFPAAALCALHRGEVLLSGGWGWIDPETRLHPARHDAVYDLASLTKLFTATAFLSLVSEGLVGLDAPLARVVPEFAASGPRPLDGGQDPHTRERLPTPAEAAGRTVDPGAVTFRHLLTHTSGLAPWRDVYNAAGPAPLPPTESEPLPRRQRWARALAAICGYPFVAAPDEGVRYSDLGLMLLGEAVSRLHSGRSGAPDEAVRERVTAPLGTASACFLPLAQGIERERIAPTERDDGWRGRRCWGEVHDENACGAGGVAGHAGLFADAGSVAALGRAWLTADRRPGIEAALMAEAVREQAAGGGERRGLGWQLPGEDAAGERFARSSFGHTGFTGTSLYVDPTRGLVVALLTNRVYPGRHRPGIHAFRRAVHDLMAEAVDRC